MLHTSLPFTLHGYMVLMLEVLIWETRTYKEGGWTCITHLVLCPCFPITLVTDGYDEHPLPVVWQHDMSPNLG